LARRAGDKFRSNSRELSAVKKRKHPRIHFNVATPWSRQVHKSKDWVIKQFRRISNLNFASSLAAIYLIQGQSMLKQFEELAVLEQGDDGAIVSIRGQGGPSVLLGPIYISHLDRVLASVLGEIHANPISSNHTSLKLLCSEIQTLVSTYEETCHKFGSHEAPSAARSLASAFEELDELRRQFDAIHS
jgi:hypothetical protein